MLRMERGSSKRRWRGVYVGTKRNQSKQAGRQGGRQGGTQSVAGKGPEQRWQAGMSRANGGGFPVFLVAIRCCTMAIWP